jgi:REP element-mobilizing transposase RayT
MSQDHNHLNRATWECKYHVVFTPKYRKKVLFGQIRRHLGTVFHELARCKECRIEEGHLTPDHVHQEMTNKQMEDATEARVLMKSHLSSQNPL